MSNHKIIFVCSFNRNVQLEAVQTNEDTLSIQITDVSKDNEELFKEIYMDKSTAIKLSRVLKSEISKLK